MCPITLYPYQREAVDAIHAAHRRGLYRVGLAAATGSGKTLMAATVADECGERTLWLAHRAELIHQAAQKIGYIMPPEEVGIVMGDRNQFDKDVVVASVDTIGRADQQRRLDQLGRFGLVVIDEAHHIVAPKYRRILEHIGVIGGKTKALGISATWDRADGKGYHGIIDRIVYRIDIEELIRSGHLADLTAVRVDTYLDMDGLPTGGDGDLKADELGRRIVESNYADTLAAAVRHHAANRISLVFAPNVRSAEVYRDALRKVGIAAEMVHGTTPRSERERIVDELRAGDIRAVVNVGVFTEGTDIPIVDCVVMGRPTASRSLYQQMAGRGLRKHPNKTNCLIIDLVGNSSRLDLQSAPSLIGEDWREGQKEIVSFQEVAASRPSGPADTEVLGPLGQQFLQKAKPVELLDRSKLSWQQTSIGSFVIPAGDQGRVVLLPDGNGTFSVIQQQRQGRDVILADHMDIGYAQGVAEKFVWENKAFHLADRNAPWRRKPATEKQLSALKNMRIAFSVPITAGEASDLILLHVSNRGTRQKAS